MLIISLVVVSSDRFSKVQKEKKPKSDEIKSSSDFNKSLNHIIKDIVRGYELVSLANLAKY